MASCQNKLNSTAVVLNAKITKMQEKCTVRACKSKLPMLNSKSFVVISDPDKILLDKYKL